MDDARMTGTVQDESLKAMPGDDPRQPQPPKRRKALSPELRELLHMLKSLEAESASEDAAPR